MSGLRVAIVGCGRMGAERARAVRSLGACVYAVVDVERQRAVALASENGAMHVERIDDLPWGSFDAVFACTPPAVRRLAVQYAAHYRTPIFVEKPLALDACEALELVSLVERSSLIARVGYMNRYRTGVRLAREVARASDCIGLTITWACSRYAVPWWQDVSQSGGPINEQATHVVDLLRHLGGEIADIAAYGNITQTRLSAAVRFESGAVATLFYTCDMPEKSISLEVLTSRGRVRLETWNLAVAANSVDGRTPPEERSPFVTETQAFLKAAAAGFSDDDTHCDFRDAYQTQIAVDRIRSALKTPLGAPVS